MSAEECQERQHNELEALKSIFPDEFKLDESPRKLVWNKQTSVSFSVVIHLSDESYSNSSRDALPSLSLDVTFPMFYPKTDPTVSLSDPVNLSPTPYAQLGQLMHETVAKLTGTEMIYELVTILQAYLGELMQARTHLSLEEERTKKLEQISAQQSADLEREHRGNLKAQMCRDAEIRLRMEDELRRQRAPSPNVISHGPVNLDPSPASEVKFNKALHIGQYRVSTVTLGVPVSQQDHSITRPWVCYVDGLGTIVLKEYIIKHEDTHMLRDMETAVSKIEDLCSRDFFPSVLKVFGATILQGPETWKFYIAQTYASRGSLRQALSVLKQIPLATAKRWLAQLAEELVGAHRIGIRHRDISSSKVLLVEVDNVTMVTLCDWEYSAVIHEQIKAHHRPSSTTRRSGSAFEDVFAIGLVFLEMLTGDKQDQHQSLESLLQTCDMIVDESLKQFLVEVFETTSSQRLTASDLLSMEYLRSAFANEGPPNVVSSPSGPTRSRYLSDFDELSRIGRGGFGTVVRARNRLDGRIYAIKKISTHKESRVLREVSGLARLNHPSIVRYFGSWVETSDAMPASDEQSSETSDDEDSDESISDDFLSTSGIIFAHSSRAASQHPASINLTSAKLSHLTRTLFIQMEYCSGNTLRSLIDSGAVGQLYWNYFSQIVDGVRYIHGQGLIHRDLKPANIFVSQDTQLKLGDFGLATESIASTVLQPHHHQIEASIHEEHTREVGTFFYQAPELSSNSWKYDAKVDIYALGIILGEMTCQSATGMERVYMLRGLRAPAINCPLDPERHSREVHMLKALLVHDPTKRPNADELFSMLPPLAHKSLLQDTLKMLIEDSNFNKHVLSQYFHQSSKIADYVYKLEPVELGVGSTLLSERCLNNVRKVFRAHGAVDRSMQSGNLFPYNDAYKARENAVKVLDEVGNVLQLPLDFKVPYARQLARSMDSDVQRTSFAIGPVYRRDGLHTKSLLEVDFDVVHLGIMDKIDLGMEALRVLYEIILDAPLFNPDTTRITLGHSTIALSILDQARVPVTERNQVLSILCSLSHHPKRGSASSWRKSLSAVLPETCILELIKFMPDKFHTFESELERTLGLLKQPKKYAVAELETTLRRALESARTYGVHLPIVFQPFPAASSLFGVTYTLELTKNKVDVLAVGGEYTELVRSQSVPGNEVSNLCVSGFCLAGQRLVECLYAGSEDHLDEWSSFVNVVIHAYAHQALAFDLISQLWNSRISAELCFDEEALSYCTRRKAQFLVTFRDKKSTVTSNGHVCKIRALRKETTEEIAHDSVVTYLASELAESMRSAQKAKIPMLTRMTSHKREPDIIFVNHDDSRKIKTAQRSTIMSKILTQVRKLMDQLEEANMTILVVDLDAEHMQILKSLTNHLLEENGLKKVADRMPSTISRIHLANMRQSVLAIQEAGHPYVLLYSFRSPELILLNL